jgi:hypothetical protein
MRLVQSSIALPFCKDNSFLDGMKFLVFQHLGMVKRNAKSYLWHAGNSAADANVDDSCMD